MAINIIGEAFDIVFSITGKAGRFLNAKGKKICWPIWALCASYWTIRNIQCGFYSQAFFASTSIFLNLYGFYSWRKKGYDTENRGKIL